MTKRELSSQGFQEPGSVPKRHNQLELGSDFCFNQSFLDDFNDDIFGVSPDDNFQNGPSAHNYDSIYDGLTTSPGDNFSSTPILTSPGDNFSSTPFTTSPDDSQPVSNGLFLTFLNDPYNLETGFPRDLFIPEDITTFNGDNTIVDDSIIIGSSNVADSNGSSRSATDSSHSQSLRSSQELSQSPTTHGSTGAQRTTRRQQGGQPPNPNDSESLTPGETPYSPPTLVKDTLSVPAYYPYKEYRFSYIVLAHSGLPDTIQVIVNFQQALESGGVENVENVYSWEIEHRLQKYILRTGGGHGERTICKTSGRKDTSSIEVYGPHIVVKLCWCPGNNFKLFRPESGRQNTVNIQLECSFRNTNQVSSINCESAVSIRSKGPKGSKKTTYVPEIIQNSYKNIENFIRSIKGDDVQTARL